MLNDSPLSGENKGCRLPWEPVLPMQVVNGAPDRAPRTGPEGTWREA